MVQQVSNFEDGSTQGWRSGSLHPQPPINVITGGPNGTDDNFLKVFSTGIGQAGNALVWFNRTQFAGNYLNSGAILISADFKNFGNTDVTLRIAVDGPGGIFVSTQGALIPAGSDWQNISFSLAPNALTVIGNPNNLNATLANVLEIRFLHNPEINFRGAPIPAEVGVDNITTIVNANNPPIAIEDSAITNEDNPVIINVLANDSDPDSGDVLSLSSFTQGSHGTVVNNGDGTVTYSPTTNFNGTDSFTYTINDGRGEVDDALVNVTVNPVNDPAVIGGTAIGTVTEDSLLTATGNLTISDPDQGEAVFNPILSQAGIYGSFSLAGNGTWNYRLDNTSATVQALDDGDRPIDRFTVSSLDGTQATVSITVIGVAEAVPGFVDVSKSDVANNNTLVIDGAIPLTLQFAVTQTTIPASQEIIVINQSNNAISPILFTVGTASNLPNGLDLSSLLASETVDIGQFQFALRNPENGRITILNLTNVTQTGFLLSNADIQISATVATNANPSFIDEATNGLNVNALFAADTDGDRQVTLRATLFREAAFNNFVGFYVVDATTGAVLNSSGSAVTTSATTVDRQTYLQAVINNTLLGGSAPVSGQTTALTGLLNFSGIATNNIQVLPYIIANGSPSNVAANFSNVYTPLLGANADLFGHIRRLSNNAYGFEDLPGGGDADFDDLILQIAALVDA